MRTAVITGATQGIGKATAEKFLQEGFSIAVCARNNEELQTIRALWETEYPHSRIIALQADLGNEQEVKQFAAATQEALGRIDVLVNNAGLFYPGQLATEPEGRLDFLMRVNLFSAYHLTRALLPAMKEQKTGHIFNLCSIASLRAYENGGAYSITKYALQGFSENLRLELIPHRIKVTSVMPGATWSRSWAESGLPQDRFIQPEDIAAMIFNAYNLSPQANVETIIIRPLAGDI